MKFGVCAGTDIEKMKLIKEIGYDYAESHCQELASKPYEHLDAMKATGLPVAAANCFIGMRVVGEEKDYAAIDGYLSTLFEKAAYLGIRYLVFGSSGARRIPEGMSLEEGRAEIADFLKNHVAPQAEKYNIPVAIEPLRPQECNAINTIDDGVEIAKKVASPYVKVLADVAHMYCQNEPMDKLITYKDWIIHAHTSNPDPDPSTGKKRIYPKAGDAFSQSSFVEPLKAIGVECCSIEADVIDFESDARSAYEILKELR
ncbi:MAG: sugar phosphate isomerase/epimerase [Clostridia bacterium]|nr:sugar phosphate isomerase/epimerase [Clostridia bacterium]